MKELDRQEIEKIIESRDERLVDELIELVKQSNASMTAKEKKYTFKDKVADKIASFVGSWTFILLFIGLLIFWLTLNILSDKPVDPFPFILLNLLLSMIAAIQAPLIMMSQNREEKRNEAKATSDFFVNVKSELLIEDIHTHVERMAKDYDEILDYLKKLDIPENRKDAKDVPEE
ncbi:MAG: DUF1003 domain-containing protein [Clostridiales bacterium]|nr:DUF1003 domain-containing protein [Clostridiales bacterium]